MRFDTISASAVVAGIDWDRHRVTPPLTDDPEFESPQENVDEPIQEPPPVEETVDQIISMPTFPAGPAPGERQR